jgi:hypothetical protein
MGENVLSGQASSSSAYRAKQVAACTLLSWAGMYIHNAVELPMLSLFSPENLGPGLLSLVLFLGWQLRPQRQLFVFAMLAWALLHFVVGGILSVLPLAVWPFVPEQSLTHYLAHVLYAAAQLPLIFLMVSLLYQSSKNFRRREPNE